MDFIRKFCLLTTFVITCMTAVAAADRALLVGIENYRDTAKCNANFSNYADGCVPPTLGGVDDAVSMKKVLEDYYKFPNSSIRLLAGKDATAIAIRDDMEKWLIAGTKPGDRVFFLFSGHGTQLADQNGDEDDKRDEAIVPFDVRMDNDFSEFIRDDEFAEWLKNLSGRRVVMLFDACHSGTISRGLADASGNFPRYLPVIQSDYNKPATRGFDDKDDYSFVPTDILSRDLLTTKGSVDDNNTANAVFITAALPYQQAFPIPVNGKYRGALAYTFEQAHARNGETLLSILEIRDLLKEGMLELGRRERLAKQKPSVQDMYKETFQVPTVEIFSKCEDGGARLFDSGTSSTCGLQNSQSGMRISLRMKSKKPVYFVGDRFEFDVEISEEAYLYIIVFSEQDSAICVFPNEFDGNNKINAGSFPRITGKERYVFPVSEPFGRDVWVALATRRPLNVRAGQTGSWKEMFDAIGLPELKEKVIKGASRSRGVTVQRAEPLKKDEWQAVTLVVETRK